MEASEWVRRVPYYVRRMGEWDVELLVGEELLEGLSSFCDVTLTAPDGARYYGTIATSDNLSTVMARLRSQGDACLSLNHWLLVPDLSRSSIDNALAEVVREGKVESYFELLETDR
jgi:hypothetical protein